MKRTLIILLLLLVLSVLAMNNMRAPGSTTQAEQRRVKGLSLMTEDGY